jgi:hypothetical protein
VDTLYTPCSSLIYVTRARSHVTWFTCLVLCPLIFASLITRSRFSFFVILLSGALSSLSRRSVAGRGRSMVIHHTPDPASVVTSQQGNPYRLNSTHRRRPRNYQWNNNKCFQSTSARRPIFRACDKYVMYFLDFCIDFTNMLRIWRVQWKKMRFPSLLKMHLSLRYLGFFCGLYSNRCLGVFGTHLPSKQNYKFYLLFYMAVKLDLSP